MSNRAAKKNSKAGQPADRTGKKAVSPAGGLIQTAAHVTEPVPTQPFPVVGVGASAGGLEAFTSLLKALPDDTGMAFVLVQHMDPVHESALSQILSRATAMPVDEAGDGVAVKPNHVYVIPHNADMTIRGGKLRLAERHEIAGRHLPIDRFLGSLADDCKSAAIGIILSGTGSDGTQGLITVKAEGGLTFAQDERSARYSGMPISAVAAGCVDSVLPPGKIAAEITRLSHHPYIAIHQPPEANELADDAGNSFRQICLLLRSATGVDFLQYKPATIGRRIGRRMVLQRTDSLQKYLQVLRKDPSEVEALYQDILIHVTGFFRDPDAFQALRTKVLPNIAASRAAGRPIRVWVPGCSTGEEVYSVAMLLLEALGDLPGQTRIQVFGTDISEPPIQHARSGAYPEASLADVSQARLKRFFVKVESGYQVNKPVREMCVFARHDLAKDPPFSSLDLISCRNVLIYMGAALQKRTVEVFHYALRQGGYLFLGKSESLSAHDNLFALEDQKHKIYSRKPVSTPHLDLAAGPRESAARGVPESATPSAAFDIRKEAERMLLERFAPAAMVVDPDLHIVHFQGDTSAYLAAATGEPSSHLLRILRPELVVEVRAAIQKVKKHRGPASTGGIRLTVHARVKTIRVEVVPLEGRRAKACDFLVIFQEEPAPPTPAGAQAAAGAPSEITGKGASREVLRLKRELTSTREYLRSILEDHEATYEELKAASEEVLSANEELQSTNEELETTKEELQSSNEELTTLNEELQNRNVELVHLADDLSNLLVGVNIPIAILDRGLRIRRFTPMAEKTLNLIPADVGRPFGQIASNLVVTDWDRLFSEVLDQLRTVEREVQDRRGHWYALRMRPYKTADNKIDGVLIALLDIDPAKRSLEQARQARNYAEAIVETIREPLFVLDGSMKVLSANTSFYQTFRTSPQETVDRSVFELGGGQWEIPRLRQLLEVILPQDTRIDDFEVDHQFPVIGYRHMLLNARQIHREGVGTGMILLAIKDITEMKDSQAALFLYQQELRALTAKLISAHETSSKHLARELHDVFGQKLAVLGMEVSALEKEPSQARGDRLRGIAGQIGDLARDIHQISRQLHPAILDDLGLAAALRNECLAFSKQYGIPVEFTSRNIQSALPEDVSLCLYRVAQESLRNIAKHSVATEVRVSLTGGSGEVLMVIENAGAGFELGAAKGKGGLGLVSMDERVRLVNGTFSIHSEPATGTRVEVRVPSRRREA
jgi:two-component system CheB/CheR fusion protein